jgi:multiple antibiotic resistance protein
MEQILQIGVNALYLVVLINPISKVAILGALLRDDQQSELSRLVTKSTLVAAGILMVSMVGGEFLLRTVFHVRLFSFQLAGGIVVAWVGFTALRHGVFFEEGHTHDLQDIAMVPLACPMIAGPASITACMGLVAQQGVVIAILSMLVAVGANHVVMLASKPIHMAFSRHNIMSALIRITGLLVMTIGVEMILTGIAAWYGSIKP